MQRLGTTLSLVTQIYAFPSGSEWVDNLQPLTNLEAHCTKQRKCAGIGVDELLWDEGFECQLLRHNSVLQSTNGERKERR
jgi:hypothetical protein